MDKNKNIIGELTQIAQRVRFVYSRWLLFGIVFLGAASLHTAGFACDSGWQYIGRPPGAWITAMEDPLDPHVVLVGSDHQTLGGVFRHTDPDTTWEAAGLQGLPVNQLTNFSYCRPNQVFAITYDGL